MAINKIALDGTTLIDLSTDTVASSDDIVQGKVGHLNDGSVVTGTASSGGGTDGPLEMIGQMDTRVYISNGNMNTNSSSPGPFSTYVYEMPFTSGDAERLCILVQKPEATNRCRVGFYTSNPLDATVSPSGQVIAGFTINNIIQDGSSLLSGANGAAPNSGYGGYKYVGIFVSGESGSAPYPKVWVAHG